MPKPHITSSHSHNFMSSHLNSHHSANPTNFVDLTSPNNKLQQHSFSTHNRNYTYETQKKKSGMNGVMKNIGIIDLSFDDEKDHDEDELQYQECEADKISEVIKNLMLKNKINARNAFDVPVIDITELDSIKNNDESAWSKISNVLENSSKVYGFRVDFIADTIHKITNNISRAEKTQQMDALGKKQRQKVKQRSNQIQDQLFIKPDGLEMIWQQQMYSKHLQKQKINSKFEQGASNTNNQSLRRLLDQNSLSNLLMCKLPISHNLNLTIDPSIQYRQINTNNSKDESKLKARCNDLGAYNNLDIRITEQIYQFSQYCLKDVKEDEDIANIDGQDVDCWNLQFQDIEVTRHDGQDYADDLARLLTPQNQGDSNLKKVMLQIPSQETSMFSNFIIRMEPLHNAAGNKLCKQKQLAPKDKKKREKKEKVKIQETLISFDCSTEFCQRESVLSISRSRTHVVGEDQSRKKKDKNVIIKTITDFAIQKQTTYVRNITLPNPQTPQHPSHQLYDSPTCQLSNINTSLLVPNIKQTKGWLWSNISKKGQYKISKLHEIYEKQKGCISPTIIFLSALHLANQHNLQIRETNNWEVEIVNMLGGGWVSE